MPNIPPQAGSNGRIYRQWPGNRLHVAANAWMITRVILESSGEIDTFCEGAAKAGERTKIYFRTEDDLAPPFKLRIRSPGGVVIVERVLRELPLGPLYGIPSVEFLTPDTGEYKIEIRQIQGATQDQDSYRPPPQSNWLAPESVPSKSVPPPNAAPSGAALLFVS